MYTKPVIRSIFLCLLLGLIFPLVLRAQTAPEVHAGVDTASIRIGEQIKLRLTASLPANQFGTTKIGFPVLPDSLEHFEVVSRGKIDTSGDQQLKVMVQTIVLTSFDSGHWDIPPMRFDVQQTSNNAVVDTLFTMPVGVNVGTVTVDTTKAFRPIKTVQSAPWRIWDYGLEATGGLLLVLIIIGIIWFIRTRRKVTPEKPTPTVTPYELAIQQLHSLKAEEVWQRGDVKMYYTRLTDILRTYFEHQFGIAALEQTTEELLHNIKPVTKLNQQRDKLRELLTIADLAKFAKMQPTAEEHEACMRQTEEILEWTRPKKESENEGVVTQEA
ncbi:hypothetical protein CLV59_109121 [Chitinophaga dinghuensis]|uniref:Uncharacterized protein n=1 Tax=Chitinophaga dinghuensis TaxID=1539050 RepID=A0A327VQ72_9BACT|nr:hypothetical protein [Chitinophaga dinghuensis]RAJ75507.1 hypothetical protein CLV59_109121 [Chitinophaga dinghuensis]